MSEKNVSENENIYLVMKNANANFHPSRHNRILQLIKFMKKQSIIAPTIHSGVATKQLIEGF